MTFLLQFVANPLFLIGIGAAAVPLVLHLMHRRKAVEIPFPSLRFLRLSQNRSARRKRIEELLLLLLRMLAVACLALALAGPFFGSAGLGGAAEPCAVAVVLDTSYSMALNEGPPGRRHTRLEVAQRLADLALQGLVNDQSQACLIPTGLQWEAAPLDATAQNPPGVPTPAAPDADNVASWANAAQLSGRIDRVREFVWQAQAAGAPADLKLALLSALQQLEQSPLRRKELVILTDLQRVDWEPALAALAATADPAAAYGDIQIALFDVRETRPEDRRDTANLAVETLTLTARQKRIGAPVVVAARLRNYSDQPMQLRVNWDWGRLPQNTPLTPAAAPDSTATNAGPYQPALWLQQNHAEKELLVPAHATADVTFETVFREQGAYLGRFTAGQDDLPIDNARYMVHRVADRIPVAIVPNAREHVFYQSSAFYLQSALDPFGPNDAKGRQAAFAVELLPATQLAAADLSQYAAILLAGVDNLPPATVKRLTDYVQQGGGLAIFPAEGADLDRLTAQLGVLEQTEFGPGGGLLPGRFAERFGDPTQENGGLTLRIQDHEHPAMLAFRGRFADLLHAVVVRAGVDLRIADNSPARTLLATTDARPIMAAVRVGRGEVVQFATSCDGRWSNLPVTHVFPVILHDLVQAMSTAGGDTGQQPLGSMSARGADLPDGPVTIFTPDGRAAPARHAPQQPAAWRACAPGFYEVLAPGNARDLFAANLDAAQSDLAPLDPAAVRTAFAWSNAGHGPLLGQGSAILTAGADLNNTDAARLLASLRSGYQASRDLLLLALALFLIELLLTERFFQPNTPSAAAPAETAATIPTGAPSHV